MIEVTVFTCVILLNIAIACDPDYVAREDLVELAGEDMEDPVSGEYAKDPVSEEDAEELVREEDTEEPGSGEDLEDTANSVKSLIFFNMSPDFQTQKLLFTGHSGGVKRHTFVRHLRSVSNVLFNRIRRHNSHKKPRRRRRRA
uniref:Putative ubiquitin-conjugating enzyme E2 R521 n=1 Tax=Lygus hesperus TaxID=30085 RepID=A0A0A9YXX7_LYGHE